MMRRQFLRRAFTLVEFLLSMLIGSAALTGTVVVFGVVLQTDRQSHQQAYTTAVVGRLSAAFRSDVHRAKSITPLKGIVISSLAMVLDGDNKVEYCTVPEGVVRIEKVNGKPDRNELFKLPKDFTTDFESNTQAKPIVARLRIASAEPIGIRLVIEALAEGDAENKP